MESGIYTITSPSGKQYVGSAVDFGRRWAGHLQNLRKGSHHNKPLQAAFLKYGEQGLKFDILLICEKRDLLMYEQRAIDALLPSYNTCRTAGSTFGMKLSDEHRRKISIGGKGLKRAKETCERISLANKGKRLSESTLLAMSASLKGKTPANKGKRHSKETLEKISRSLVGKTKGHPKSPAHREAISKSKSASGLRGAHLCKKTGRWIATAWLDGKQKYLGRHDTPELAHATVLAAESIQSRIINELVIPRPDIMGSCCR